MADRPFEAPSRRSAFGAAWLLWAGATAGALVFVLVLGVNVPYWDEWELVPMVTGSQPLTPSFLWSLHNEHRIPLPRLAYYAVFGAFRDFRAVAVFNVLVLSAGAAFLIAMAGRARGRGSWADGFLALALLNLGHADNMLWGFQVQFTLTGLLVALVLGTSACVRGRPRPSEALAIGVPLLLAPLCGATGVPLALLGGAWLLGWAARAARTRDALGSGAPRPASPALLGGLGLACWAVVGLYLFRYRGNPGHPKPAGVKAGLLAVTEFLSVTPGAAGGWYWPWSTALVAALVAATVVALAVWWWRDREDRTVAEGLLAGLGALLGLAVAVGWGRSGFGPGAAMAGRYATLAAPIACAAYLAWCRLPWPGAARAVQAACALAVLSLYGDNLAAGREAAFRQRAGLQVLAKDVRRGLSLAEVAGRHAGDVYPNPLVLHERLVLLRRERLGPFAPEESPAKLARHLRFVGEPLVEVRDGVVPVRADRVMGHQVVVVHANGDLVFDVRPGLRRASGSFGLLPEFYDRKNGPGEPAYDGTHLSATFVPDEGEPVPLFGRRIDPQRNPGDRGLLPFAVGLPGSGGKLILSTRFGSPEQPDANGFGDWAFWADLDLR
jgi:hypothetical protein